MTTLERLLTEEKSKVKHIFFLNSFLVHERSECDRMKSKEQDNRT